MEDTMRSAFLMARSEELSNHPRFSHDTRQSSGSRASVTRLNDAGNPVAVSARRAPEATERRR
eukprot:7954973-Alexandrium_andersonii.AAC.1